MGRWLQGLFWVFLTTTGYAQEIAQETAPDVPTAVVSAQAPDESVRWDVPAMQAYADGLIDVLRRKHDVPGVIVTVVSRDEVLINAGYGYSDRAARKAVDPDRTLFRVGSVSKLMTWIAVMQQVDAGLLELDGDINQWLGDVQIPATYAEPITLEHVMSHTPGFEDHVIGLFARQASELSLSELLATQMPKRVRPPGAFGSYSNHATAMAALAVQNVSGLDYHDYVDEHIFGPLEMSFATTRQPLPAALGKHMSVGYLGKGAAQKVYDFEFVPLAPAGSTSASGAAMGRFMQALLGDRRDRILSDTTWARMQQPLYGHDERLAQPLHGFYEQRRQGVRSFGHGGDTAAFHSMLNLYPEHGVGLFLSTNSDGGPALRSSFIRAFENRFLRAGEADPLKPAALADLQAYAGWYRPIRYAHTSLAKVAALISAAPVGVDPEGYLTFPDGELQAPKRLGRVDGSLFRDSDGGAYAFREAEGSVTHLFIGAVPMIAFERVGFFLAPPFQFAVVGIACLLLAMAAITWGVRALRGGVLPAGTLVMAGISVGPLLLVVYIITLLLTLANASEIAFGVPTSILILQALPLLAIPSILLGAWTLAGVWSEPGRGRWLLLMSTLAATALLWWLWQWNLLGYWLG